VSRRMARLVVAGGRIRRSALELIEHPIDQLSFCPVAGPSSLLLQ
jgi:hypothetical protein